MKRFLIKTILFFLPVLVVVMVVNYWGDPAKVFSDQGVEVQAVEILSAGGNVAGLSNYDERLFQRQWIETMTKSPSVVVLGSSRGMLVNRSNSADSGLMNFCVSGARLEDMIGIWGLCENRQWRPKRVILEISTYMFNDRNTDTRYKTLEEEFNTVANKFSVKGGVSTLQLTLPKAWSALCSPSYFQSALQSLINKDAPDVIYATEERMGQSDAIKLIDGSISYSLAYRTRGVSAQDLLDAINYGGGERFVRMAAERQELFESFVAYLLNQGVEVELFLAPLPSEVTENSKMPALVAAYLSAFAQEKGVLVQGSYSAEQYGLTVANFYDGLHPEQSVYDTILSENYH